MAIIPISPVPSRLAGDLDAGAAALAFARAALKNAGEAGRAFTRVALTVGSKGEVDAVADEWGVAPAWTRKGDIYMALWRIGDYAAEVEVVYWAAEGESASP